MKKGIILEMNERFLTLLTPDGEFLKMKKKSENYEIGQEILIPLQRNPWTSLLSFLNTITGKSVLALSIASILLLSLTLPGQNNEVYAYMSIDINPSIELGINKDLKVIEVIPYNESGKKVVEELPQWKMKDIKEVTDAILANLKGKGYLQSQQNILIGTVHTGKEIEKSELQLQQVMNEIKNDVSEEKITVITVEATKKDREEAIENKITPGKLIVDKKAEEKKLEPQSKNDHPVQKSISPGNPNNQGNLKGSQKDDNKVNNKQGPEQQKAEKTDNRGQSKKLENNNNSKEKQAEKVNHREKKDREKEEKEKEKEKKERKQEKEKDKQKGKSEGAPGKNHQNKRPEKKDEQPKASQNPNKDKKENE